MRRCNRGTATAAVGRPVLACPVARPGTRGKVEVVSTAEIRVVGTWSTRAESIR